MSKLKSLVVLLTIFSIPSGIFAFQPLFDTWISYDVGSEPFSIVVSDLDGDGDLDLAVTNSGLFFDQDTSISVLMNKGDGTFADKVDYRAGARPIFVVATDVDGDGKQDLVTSNYKSNTVSVLKNNGN